MNRVGEALSQDFRAKHLNDPGNLDVMKIIIIGGGAMGQAFARGLGSDNSNLCAVVERDAHNARVCESLGTRVFSSLSEVANDPQFEVVDVAVIAVKPQDVQNVGSEIRQVFQSQMVLVSIAAGLSIKTLQEHCGEFPIVRAMPNIAASELLSATAMCCADQLSEHDEAKARRVLESLGIVVRVDENQMNLVTAISGSGPAYFFLLAELLANVAEEQGMSKEVAHELIAQTFLGAATMAKANGSFATLRERVTSKGGTTEAAIAAFREHDLANTVSSGVIAAIKRGQELNRDSGQEA